MSNGFGSGFRRGVGFAAGVAAVGVVLTCLAGFAGWWGAGYLKDRTLVSAREIAKDAGQMARAKADGAKEAVSSGVSRAKDRVEDTKERVREAASTKMDDVREWGAGKRDDLKERWQRMRNKDGSPPVAEGR